MIELPVLIENIIEIVNVAIEMMLVFLYFSLLSKAKVNKAVLYLSYLLSTVILSATVLLTDNILVYLITTIILISSMSFICYDDSIRHKIFWNILFLLIILVKLKQPTPILRIPFMRLIPLKAAMPPFAETMF